MPCAFTNAQVLNTLWWNTASCARFAICLTPLFSDSSSQHPVMAGDPSVRMARPISIIAWCLGLMPMPNAWMLLRCTFTAVQNCWLCAGGRLAAHCTGLVHPSYTYSCIQTSHLAISTWQITAILALVGPINNNVSQAAGSFTWFIKLQ